MLYSRVVKTLASSAGRYPSRDEEAKCRDWAVSLPERLRAANLLTAKETDIIREAVDRVKPLYLRFPSHHDRAWEKATRDMGLVLRYAVQGMIVDDPDMAKDKLYVWLGTIVRGTGHTPELFRDCYTAVIDTCRVHLPPDLFGIASPYLERALEDMSSFGEPTKPAVN